MVIKHNWLILLIYSHWFNFRGCKFNWLFCLYFQYGQCMVCNGFHGSNFGQPVCSSCHLFLFSNDINLEDGEQEVYNEVISDLAWISGIKLSRDPVAQYHYNLACATEHFQTNPGYWNFEYSMCIFSYWVLRIMLGYWNLLLGAQLPETKKKFCLWLFFFFSKRCLK